MSNKCGTINGYNIHKRASENPCEPCKTAASQYAKSRYEANKERLKKIRAEYYANNKETMLAQSKVWYENNKEKVKLAAQKHYQTESYRQKAALKANIRRTRKKNGIYEKYTLEQVIDTYGSLCYICGTNIDLSIPRWVGKKGWQFGLHIDHVIPISKGGADILENVRPSHGICNVRKGSKLTKEGK